jgi:hypothetical protein
MRVAYEYSYDEPLGDLYIETNAQGSYMLARFCRSIGGDNDDSLEPSEQKVYEVKLERADIVNLHRVFIGMPEYLAEYVGIKPECAEGEGCVVVKFNVEAGRRRWHTFAIKVPELRSEATKMAVLEGKIDELKNMIVGQRVAMESLARVGIYGLIGADREKIEVCLPWYMDAIDISAINGELFVSILLDFSSELFEILVEEGLDVNTRSLHGVSYFFSITDYLAEYEDVEIERIYGRVEFMITRGLDMTIRNARGESIMDELTSTEAFLHKHICAIYVGDQSRVERLLPMMASLKECALAHGAK